MQTRAALAWQGFFEAWISLFIQGLCRDLFDAAARMRAHRRSSRRAIGLFRLESVGDRTALRSQHAPLALLGDGTSSSLSRRLLPPQASSETSESLLLVKACCWPLGHPSRRVVFLKAGQCRGNEAKDQYRLGASGTIRAAIIWWLKLGSTAPRGCPAHTRDRIVHQQSMRSPRLSVK